MATHSMLYYYTMKTQWLFYNKVAKALINMCYNEIWIEILPFSFKKIHLEMSSAKMAAILCMGVS